MIRWSAVAVHTGNLFDLSGKVAFVSGGSRGLGLEIASGLVEAGARIAVSARRDSWLRSADEELRALGPPPLVLHCDVANPEQVHSAVSATIAEFGRIDILVNNAGISWAAPAEQMPVEKWQAVMDVNALGTFLMCQTVGREMIKEGGGKIINIASVAGLGGSSPSVLDAVGYSASKGAVIGLTRDLAVKWAIHGITVNAIAPGYFPTRMTEGVLKKSLPELEKLIPMGRVGRPGELKGAAVFLASRASDYITGHVLAVDGGYLAW
jgi:NAD(P)-dependent dehydrogenase (short-subunit alcohol dehydrogenase family)